jgi:D-threonate/D-erythronate kinase
LEGNALFVCGSSSESSRQALKKAETLGTAICRMPEELFQSEDPGNKCFGQWCDEITGCFKDSRCVIMAIDRLPVGNAAFAAKLHSSVAKTVSAVFRKILLKEIFVEGGATASGIVERLGWNRFEPCDQLGPGVVRMKVMESDNIYLTIKPGSYPWPEIIWNLLSKGICRA